MLFASPSSLRSITRLPRKQPASLSSFLLYTKRNMATIYYEPSGCNCDNKTTYTKAQINAACTQALKLASEKKTVGNDKYPHVYNDYEKFTFSHAQKPYLEFPILENESAYTGDESPGADRIVIGSIATDYASAVYCATITHDGSTKNGFTECKDDTVNTDGKGTYESPEQQQVGEGDGSKEHPKRHPGHKRRAKEPGPDRELLDRIDY